MVDKYIPKQGDIVYIDFSPVIGHEQSDYRPGIVISNNVFNNNTKKAIICPITSNIEDFPTHYILEDTNIVSGEVIYTIVNNLYYYDSFSELYKDHDKVSLGYREDEDANC